MSADTIVVRPELLNAEEKKQVAREVIARVEREIETILNSSSEN